MGEEEEEEEDEEEEKEEEEEEEEGHSDVSYPKKLCEAVNIRNPYEHLALPLADGVAACFAPFRQEREVPGSRKGLGILRIPRPHANSRCRSVHDLSRPLGTSIVDLYDGDDRRRRRRHLRYIDESEWGQKLDVERHH